MKVAASWSGGKDSCLACHKAVLDGFQVSYLLNFTSKDGGCISHGLDSKLMVAQSQAIGIPIIQREVTWDTYEEGFKASMMRLKKTGVEGAVFGDIEIEGHRDWVYRVCGDIDVKPIEPLWGLNPEKILADFIDEGFEACVVNCKADIMGVEWLGRKIDDSFLEELRAREIHLCGEGGEYHTFVTDGPLFNKRIRIVDSRRVLREGYWKFWLLEILDYDIEEKNILNEGVE